MTREEFNNKTFDEVLEQLYQENDNITTFEILKEYIKKCVDNEDFNLVLHLVDSIWNDPNSYSSDWYEYDYSMGLLDKPVCLSEKEHVEHLIEN